MEKQPCFNKIVIRVLELKKSGKLETFSHFLVRFGEQRKGMGQVKSKAQRGESTEAKNCVLVGLYPRCAWSPKAIRKLVCEKKLAPIFKGVEDPPAHMETDECPICFLVRIVASGESSLTVPFPPVLSLRFEPDQVLQTRDMHRYGVETT
jgi:hypothetical protein